MAGVRDRPWRKRLRGLHQQPIHQYVDRSEDLHNGHRDRDREHVRGAGRVLPGGGEAEQLLQRLHVKQRDSDQVWVGYGVECSTKYEKTIYCANCGDSRSVLCRNGACVELSVCHNTNNDTEVKRVMEMGGW